MSRSMERLSNARPAIADGIDRDALFAQIVAIAQDHQQPQISRSGRRRLAIGCIAVVVLCLSAGTAFAVTGGFNLFGWHTDTTIVKSPREWQRLYRDATRQLTLPPGQHWPNRTLPPETVTSRTQPGGTAVAIAQTAWECYWVGAIRHGDAAAGAQAHAALEELLAHHVVVAPPGSPENVAPPGGTTPPFEIYASDGGIRFVRRMYRNAASGDPTTLIQSCRANGPVGTR
jgi:hypothetical protein